MSAAADLTPTGTTAEALAATVPELVARIASLEGALIEREAALVWQQETRTSWYRARSTEREEFRDYARAQLTLAGLLPEQGAI